MNLMDLLYGIYSAPTRNGEEKETVSSNLPGADPLPKEQSNRLCELRELIVAETEGKKIELYIREYHDILESLQSSQDKPHPYVDYSWSIACARDRLEEITNKGHQNA